MNGRMMSRCWGSAFRRAQFGPCDLTDDWVQCGKETIFPLEMKLFTYAGNSKTHQLSQLKNTGNFTYDAELYKWDALKPFNGALRLEKNRLK